MAGIARRAMIKLAAEVDDFHKGLRVGKGRDLRAVPPYHAPRLAAPALARSVGRNKRSALRRPRLTTNRLSDTTAIGAVKRLRPTGCNLILRKLENLTPPYHGHRTRSERIAPCCSLEMTSGLGPRISICPMA